ncbi:hypothetical protein TRIUR3_13913 [Triticum urartu]|uniref:Uncharacterized protein n=1 Tax=Triticum urartu TaxID=4572 RepID=M7ZUP7_TRIUA|nr:hypothetical protein TRIUR3_13913 [Triticum urartu]
MSSSKPCPAASSSGDLPVYALYEVLLRIPAKDLCRLRAVCPSWRALTSDPFFIAAHMCRHHTAPPLLAIAYRDDGEVNGVAISDLLGNVVKRFPNNGYEIVLVNESGDAVHRLTSKGDIIRVKGMNKWRCQIQSCAIGQVSSTREYKALRVSRIGDRQACEIITVDDMNNGSWRRKQDPPSRICSGRKMRWVVVHGMV